MNDSPVIVEQHFNIDPPILWEAITSQEQMIQWFFTDIPDFRPEVGFKTSFVVENEGRVFPHLWKIIEVIPNKKIVYDWRYEGYKGDSEVKFSIDKTTDGCKLTVEHTVGNPFDQSIPEFTRESCEGGWNYFIKESLVSFLNKN